MRIPGIPFHQGRNDYTDSDGRHFGIAIHNTSNVASDEDEASYADHRTDGTSSHFYVDGDSVTQSLDTDDKAGHAGSRQGNENAIAFEITGTNDKSRQWWLSNVAWDKLGYVIAYVLRHDPDYVGFQVRRASVAEMKANPQVRAFYGHDDMRLAWGGTTHTDPGPGFPWDRLFEAVNDALNGDDMATTDPIDIPNYDGDPALPAVERTTVGTALGVASQRSWQALAAARRVEVKVDQLLARPAAVVDVQALAAALAPLLGVDQAAVVAALQSDAGRAALEAAAFGGAQRAERE